MRNLAIPIVNVGIVDNSGKGGSGWGTHVYLWQIM